MRADVAAWLDARCVRSPRAWGEADRLHTDFTACGGRLEREAMLAELTTHGRAWLGPAGLVCGVGLLQDWPAEVDAARQARGTGRGHRGG